MGRTMKSDFTAAGCNQGADISVSFSLIYRKKKKTKQKNPKKPPKKQQKNLKPPPPKNSPPFKDAYLHCSWETKAKKLVFHHLF